VLIADEIINQINEGKVTPMNNLIIIKRDNNTDLDSSGVSAGGIILPGSAFKAEDWGTVVAVPKTITDKDGTKREPNLKVGDRVFTRPSDGDKVFPLHKNYQFVRYERVEALDLDGKVVPFEYRVLAEKLEGETKTLGGLFLPESSAFTARGKKIPRTGRSKVLSVGLLVEGIEVGDIVCTEKHDGCEVENEDGIECLTIETREIYGIE
jgi:co-chaperonin GroES (HSP10)